MSLLTRNRDAVTGWRKMMPTFNEYFHNRVMKYLYEVYGPFHLTQKWDEPRRYFFVEPDGSLVDAEPALIFATELWMEHLLPAKLGGDEHACTLWLLALAAIDEFRDGLLRAADQPKVEGV